MKLAFVIQRYGEEILGGGESLCREVAENLALSGEEISVYTTTAKDYLTWKNRYPSGITILKGVTIKRYKVKKQRNLKTFNKFSDWIFFNPHTYQDETRWVEAQGPVCPDLIKSLEKEQEDFDLVVFFTYLYYPTYWGLKKIKKRKILVPFAHDEPPLYLDLMKEVFSTPDGFIFNTQAEKELVEKNFSIKDKLRLIGGKGIRIPSPLEKSSFKKKHGLYFPYILYAGRIDEGKGCQELIDCYFQFKKNYPFIHLVLIGKLNMNLPSDPDIRYLGFLSEDEKLEAIVNAEVTVHPSRLESFSIALLESLACRTPVLVQKKCPVLMEHCLKSNAGLYYSNCEEFIQALHFLLREKRIREKLAENGFKYIKESYSWQKIVEKYKKAFKEILPESKSPER